MAYCKYTVRAHSALWLIYLILIEGCFPSIYNRYLYLILYIIIIIILTYVRSDQKLSSETTNVVLFAWRVDTKVRGGH